MSLVFGKEEAEIKKEDLLAFVFGVAPTRFRFTLLNVT